MPISHITSSVSTAYRNPHPPFLLIFHLHPLCFLSRPLLLVNQSGLQGGFDPPKTDFDWPEIAQFSSLELKTSVVWTRFAIQVRHLGGSLLFYQPERTISNSIFFFLHFFSAFFSPIEAEMHYKMSPFHKSSSEGVS